MVSFSLKGLVDCYRAPPEKLSAIMADVHDHNGQSASKVSALKHLKSLLICENKRTIIVS